MVVLLWIVLCVFVSFPDLFIGAHAKKQGEDLADNDGEEDEGILFGDEVSSMFLNLFGVFFTPPPPPPPLSLHSIWMKPFGIYLYFPHYHDPKHQHSESECEWMGFWVSLSLSSKEFSKPGDNWYNSKGSVFIPKSHIECVRRWIHCSERGYQRVCCLLVWSRRKHL